MKKIIFLLVLSVTNFSEMAWTMEMPQLQKIERRFDKDSVLKQLQELGINTEGESYSNILKNEGYQQIVSSRIKELERQILSIVEAVRNDQMGYNEKLTDELKLKLEKELDQAIGILDTDRPAGVFDAIRSFAPSDKYKQLESILLNILECRDDKIVLGFLKEALEKTQSIESIHDALLEMRRLVDTGFSHALVENPPVFGFKVLKGIINKFTLTQNDDTKKACPNTLTLYLDDDTKKACLHALAQCNSISWHAELNELANKHGVKKISGDYSLSLLKLCCKINDNVFYILDNVDFPDISSSSRELEKRAILAAAKFHSASEEINFPYLKEQKIRVSGLYNGERYAPAGLYMLRQDLACLLSKLASASDFDEMFTRGDYDAYCNEVDNMNSFSRHIDLKKSPKFSGAYEAIENSIRASFLWVGARKNSPFIKSIRLFVSSLRDIVRYNSDVVAKKQAIGRALFVLEALGQEIPELKEEVKDVPLDLDDKLLQKVEKFKEEMLPNINLFAKEVTELGDIEKDVTPFFTEYDNINKEITNSFFKENRASFNVMLRIISDMLEKRTVEGEAYSKDLQNKVAETKKQLSQMSYNEIYDIMHSQDLNVKFAVPKDRIKALGEAEISEYQLSEDTDLDELRDFIEDRLCVRFYHGTIKYVMKLAEYRISLLQMLKPNDRIQLIDENLFSGLERSSEDGVSYYLNMIKPFSDTQPYQNWSRVLNQNLPVFQELDALRAIRELMNENND